MKYVKKTLRSNHLYILPLRFYGSYLMSIFALLWCLCKISNLEMCFRIILGKTGWKT